MRYAVFTDIHANLEALEAVLAKIDELAQEKPIDQIWFLGDLVGYGPNPNECIDIIRERTNVIIAGNHDWAAVGKIDLEDFSEAARLSAQWTAKQLTDEHRTFLINLPERIETHDCVLVHGSPYGPLWEYLTSEVLAERSFQYFTHRFCFVGHTHVPIIFQQPDTVANSPTLPLELSDIEGSTPAEELLENHANNHETTPPTDAQVKHNGETEDTDDATSDGDDTIKLAAIRPTLQAAKSALEAESAHATDAEALQDMVANAVDVVAEIQQNMADDAHGVEPAHLANESDGESATAPAEQTTIVVETTELDTNNHSQSIAEAHDKSDESQETGGSSREITPEETILSAEERLNEEIEELLALLGLSQSMISVTNEMIVPPEGTWQAPGGYRAIINPGGVGQPRDGDPRAACMIYDTERGFTFYRVEYDYQKTQEKIIKAELPQYLATRLAYGR